MSVYYPPDGNFSNLNFDEDPKPELVTPVLAYLLPLNEEMNLTLSAVKKYNDADGMAVTTVVYGLNIAEAITFTTFVKGEDPYKCAGIFYFFNKDIKLVGKIIPIMFKLKGSNDDVSDIKINIFLV